jgi:hypothetical protein
MSLLLLAALGAQAQDPNIRAFVQSVKGRAKIYTGSGDFTPPINFPLEPGNRIETGWNGRVIVSLSDGGRGSQIKVLPNSKVTFKNFRDPQTVRELLEIGVGRVIVKIHHVGGKPNPYRLNSPAASIAVRGTEFTVDVQLGGETLVLVREGLVEVWPRNDPDNKRLVSPGGRVTVQPGGNISSAFPGPRRSLEYVAQNTSDISPIFFSAFPDQHQDSLDNPAYAADIKEGQGRLLLLPSISEPQYVDVRQGQASSKSPPYYDYSVFPQLTFFMPIPDSRFVIGGGVSALRTKLRELANYEFPSSQNRGDQTTGLNVINASIIAAYSFGNQGKTSVGIGFDRLAGDESDSSHTNYISTSSKYLFSDESYANIVRTRLTLGLTRRLNESMKIGLYYRHGFSSSDQNTIYHREYITEPPNNSYFFAAAAANISTSSSSSELGLRFRGALKRRFFYGVEGSYMYERFRSRIGTQNQATVADNRYLGRRARVGVGLGYSPFSRILLNMDVAGGLFNSSRPLDQPVSLGANWFGLTSTVGGLSSLQSSPRGSRGTSVSVHWSVQTNPWRNLFFSLSSVKTFRRDYYKYIIYGKVEDHPNSYTRTLYNAGIGWKFKPNFIAEYLISADPRERVPSHSLRLRYTFNLGVTNEK